MYTHTHFVATILLEFRLFLFSSHLNVRMSVKVNYIKKRNEYRKPVHIMLQGGRCGTSNFVSKSNKLLHKFRITMAYAYTNQFCFMFLLRSSPFRFTLLFTFFPVFPWYMNFLCANLMLHIQKVHKIIARR